MITYSNSLIEYYQGTGTTTFCLRDLLSGVNFLCIFLFNFLVYFALIFHISINLLKKDLEILKIDR